MSIPTQAEAGGEMAPGTRALFTLVELCSPGEVHTEYLRRYHAGEGKFFGDMKKRLAQDVIALTDPIRERFSRLGDDDVRDVLARGAGKVRPIAAAVLSDMQRAMGLKGG